MVITSLYAVCHWAMTTREMGEPAVGRGRDFLLCSGGRLFDFERLQSEGSTQANIHAGMYKAQQYNGELAA